MAPDVPIGLGFGIWDLPPAQRHVGLACISGRIALKAPPGQLVTNQQQRSPAMNVKTTRVDVWAAEIDDKPGGLAATLRAIADKGIDLECVIARRQSGKPGKGRVLVSPQDGKHPLEGIPDLMLRRATEVPTLRIEGSNEAGAGAKLTKTVADAGVSMHGLSAMTFGHRFVCYASFDSVEELQKAEAAIGKIASSTHWPFWRHKVA
ncbi:MAG TPA: hypothetical protein VHE61_07520 [Opitutaceae bacterium]|nr:hypothetical protein [Opitutaceae bacterium]